MNWLSLLFITLFSASAFGHKIDEDNAHHPSYFVHTCDTLDAQTAVEKFELDIYSLYLEGSSVFTIDPHFDTIENTPIPKELLLNVKKAWVEACIHHYNHYADTCRAGDISQDYLVKLCNSRPIEWDTHLLPLIVVEPAKE